MLSRFRLLCPRGLFVAVSALCLLAVTPSQSLANDAGVLRAVLTHAQARASADKAFLKAAKAYGRGGPAGPLLVALARERTVTIRMRRAVLAQLPSSPHGAAARSALLRGLGLGEQALLQMRSSIFAQQRGDAVAAKAKLDRALELAARSEEAVKQSIEHFKQAGFDLD